MTYLCTRKARSPLEKMKSEPCSALPRITLSGNRKPFAGLVLVWLVLAAGNHFCLGQTVETSVPRVSVYARAYLEEGQREMRRGSYLRAIRLFSAAIRNGANGYKLRGQAYFLSGEWDQALADVNQYLSLQPSDSAAYVLRGDIATGRGIASAAVHDYSIAVKLAPSSTDGYVSRGLAYMALERYSLAIRDFETVLSIDPRNLDALSNLGVANMLANRPHAAREFFDKAMRIETDPKWKEKLSSWVSLLPPRASAGPDRDLPPDHGLSGGESAEPGPEKISGSAEGHGSLRKLSGRTPLPALHKTPPARRLFPAPQSKWTQLSGKWEATYRGARITLEISHSGTDLSGIMKIHGPFGRDHTYHFRGTMGYDGTIRATHFSGHRFEGRITDTGSIVGTVTTKFGTTIPIDFSPH